MNFQVLKISFFFLIEALPQSNVDICCHLCYNSIRLIIITADDNTKIHKGDFVMNEYDEVTGLPIDKMYLECELPKFLVKAIEQMKVSWEKDDNGEPSDWSDDFCELQSCINVAEVEQIISSEQADYLREKYLRIRRTDEL